jgi:general secretion pathway protein I
MTLRSTELSREAGFSLVETLIAMAIIAAMMAMTFGGIAINARTTRAMFDRRAAVMVAKSALDAAVSSNDGEEMPQSGADGNLRWQIAVEPYQSRVDTAPQLDLVTVTVAPVGSDRPVLRLCTLRIAR